MTDAEETAEALETAASESLPALPRRRKGERVELDDGERLQLMAMAAQGLPQRLAAARLGIGHTTLRKVLERDPEAGLCWDQGRAALFELGTTKLLELVRHGDRVSIFFLLNNYFGMRWRALDGETDQAPLVNLNLNVPPSSMGDYLRSIGVPVEANATSDNADPESV